MRKARVWKPSKFHRWAFSLEPDDMHGVVFGYVATHAEAMFLAQLLADPARYIRQAKQSAWDNGHSWGWDDAKIKAWAERGVDIGSRADWRLLTPNPHEVIEIMELGDPG